MRSLANYLIKIISGGFKKFTALNIIRDANKKKIFKHYLKTLTRNFILNIKKKIQRTTINIYILIKRLNNIGRNI